jgi:hypothetical protein
MRSMRGMLAQGHSHWVERAGTFSALRFPKRVPRARAHRGVRLARGQPIRFSAAGAQLQNVPCHARDARTVIL